MIRTAALSLAVGLVLADSSIVVLALPEIYRSLEASVSSVCRGRSDRADPKRSGRVRLTAGPRPPRRPCYPGSSG
jgi:hypothetical protein